MKLSISKEIFNSYRLNETRRDSILEKIISQIESICNDWNSTSTGFGIKIIHTDDSITQGLCWKICLRKNTLKYFLEEYEGQTVLINPYQLEISKILKVEYLGRPKGVRPQLTPSYTSF